MIEGKEVQGTELNDSESVSRRHRGLTVPIVEQLTLAEFMWSERRVAHPFWFEFPRVAYPLRFWLLCAIPPILRDERVGPSALRLLGFRPFATSALIEGRPSFTHF